MKLKAFTLVELMVVMAIIAFLSVGAYGGLTFALRQGRDTQRMRITDQIQTALQAYYADWQHYPGGCTTSTKTISTPNGSVTLNVCDKAFSDTDSFITKGGSNGLADYFESEFVWGPFSKSSPQTDIIYYFEKAGATAATGTKFTVCATLENPRGGNVQNSQAALSTPRRGCYCVGAYQSALACVGM